MLQLFPDPLGLQALQVLQEEMDKVVLQDRPDKFKKAIFPVLLALQDRRDRLVKLGSLDKLLILNLDLLDPQAMLVRQAHQEILESLALKAMMDPLAKEVLVIIVLLLEHSQATKNEISFVIIV